MAFFFKKNEAPPPVVAVGKIPSEAAVAAVVSPPSGAHGAEFSAPSAEGLAIAKRLSGQRIAVPVGFHVRADNFQLPGGCLVAGELEGIVFGAGKNEIVPGGIINGSVSAEDLSVRGVLAGKGEVERLAIEPGGECHGNFRGSSLVLSEGGVFDGEYSRKPSARI